MLPIFSINAFLVFLYSLPRLLSGAGVTATEVVMSLFYGGSIVIHGWYLLCIMVLYELFYLSVKFCSRHVCLAAVMMTMLYMVLAKGINMPSYWYSSCLAFPCGVFFWQYKMRIDTIFRQRHTVFFCLALVLFLGSFAFSYATSGEDNSLANVYIFRYLRYLALMTMGIFSSLMIVGALMLLGNHIHEASGITKKLSTTYLEIYVMQGLAMWLLRNSRWDLDNDYLFIVCTVILTLALTVAIRPVFRKITSWVKT